MRLLPGLSLKDGDRFVGTVRAGEVTLSVSNTQDLKALKKSLEEGMAETPKPLDREYFDGLLEKARSVAAES